MTDNAQFEVATWADAEVTIGPGNPAHPDHAAWLADQECGPHGVTQCTICYPDPDQETDQ